MANATYIANVSQAREELARLRRIELNVQNEIIALMDSDHYMASAWRSIYTDRLRDNVRPAIRECVNYIRKNG